MAKKTYKLHNPKADASVGQRVYLHRLTGENTRDWKLTMGKAQELITKFKANKPSHKQLESLGLVKATPVRKASKTILEPSTNGKREQTIKRSRAKSTTSSDKLDSPTAVRSTQVKSVAAIKALNKS